MDDNYIKEVATELHRIQCRYNHTDECAWDYFANNWNDRTHQRYYNKAMRLINHDGNMLSLLKEINTHG